MRLALLPLVLLSACAHLREKPALETPGAKMFLRDPNGDGRRQWYLEIVSPGAEKSSPSLIFDEENPAMAAPASPVTLTRRPFAPAGEPAPGYYLRYDLLVATDDPPAGRGAVYYYGRQSKDVYPILWWGLDPDPKFDDAAPAENAVKLQSLFKKR